jgi:hypothetical protein
MLCNEFDPEFCATSAPLPWWLFVLIMTVLILVYVRQIQKESTMSQALGDYPWETLNALPNGATIWTVARDAAPGTETEGVEFTKQDGHWIVTYTDFPEDLPLGESSQWDPEIVTAGGDTIIHVTYNGKD